MIEGPLERAHHHVYCGSSQQSRLLAGPLSNGFAAGARHRSFVAAHPAPLGLPAPDLRRAEDYLRNANNGYRTTLKLPSL